MTARLAVHVLIGMVTWYSAEAHAGNDLRCGGVYDDSRPWIAVDVDATSWRCGDVVTVWSGGDMRTFTILDSGPLSRYCVVDDPDCVPIVADVPEHAAWFYPALSVRAVVVNATMAREAMEAYR